MKGSRAGRSSGLGPSWVWALRGLRCLPPARVAPAAVDPTTGLAVDPVRNPLDVCCVVCKVKRGPSEIFPSKGASDDPKRAYPTVGPPGRGYDRFVLPNRRHLLPAQS